MLPEVEAYFKVKYEAENARDEAYSEAEYAYNKAARAARLAYQLDPANVAQPWDSYRQQRRGGKLEADYRAYTEARAAADRKFADDVSDNHRKLRESKDLAVAWIANNSIRDYPDYSAAVLKALPTDDPSTLWEIKRQYGMCDEFDRLYARAEIDGVFNGGNKAPGAREMAALHNWISRNWGQNYARQAREQMGPYIRAVKAEHDKQLADQKAAFELEKATWQGLDEAWRSERSRRGAATRAERTREAVQEAAAEPAAADEAGTVVDVITADTVRQAVDGLRMAHANRFVSVQDDFASVVETEDKVNS